MRQQTGMRSTRTSTDERSLHWERGYSAGASWQAEYGDYRFRVWRWQRGSYLATARNTETGEEHQHGWLAGELTTAADAREWCEVIFQRLRQEDRARGIERW